MSEKYRLLNKLAGNIVFRILTIIVLAGILIAGVSCANNIIQNINENKNNYIYGTWQVLNYTTPSGVHYSKKVDTINEKLLFDETLYHDDGRVIFLKGILIENNDGSFGAHYSSFMMQIYKNTDIAGLDDPDYGIKNLKFERIEGDKNITGVWINPEPYEFEPGYDFLEITINEDNTGRLLFKGNKEDTDIPVKINWKELGTNSYVFTVTDSVTLMKKDDNTLYDNIGNVYTRVE